MASQFYNRYIPPVLEIPHASEEVRPVKRRKKDKAESSPKADEDPTAKYEEITVYEPEDRKAQTRPDISRLELDDTQNADRIQQKKKKGKGKGKEQTSESNLTETDIQTEGGLMQSEPTLGHRKILSKYRKAAEATSEGEIKNDVPHEGTETQTNDNLTVESHGLEPLPQPPQTPEPPKVSAFSALPQWLQNPTLVSTSDSIPFKDLPLHQDITNSLERKGYSSAFSVQAALLPMLLPGPLQHTGDICVSAATGSGKTLAYALPMVESLRDMYDTKLRGLILVPTRELVTQVRETLDLCISGTRLKVGTAVGSKSLSEEQDLLVEKNERYDPKAYKAERDKDIDHDEELLDWTFEKSTDSGEESKCSLNHVTEHISKVDILICTPGRLVDHVQSTRGFSLENVKMIVIDEADRLLDESFQQWVDIVLPPLEYLPPLSPVEAQLQNTFHILRRRKVRKIILSATMTRDISKLTALNLGNPRFIVLEAQNRLTKTGNEDAEMEDFKMFELPSTLKETAVAVAKSENKPLYLIHILENIEDLFLRNTSLSEMSGDVEESSDSEDSSEDDDELSESSSSSEPESESERLIKPHKKVQIKKVDTSDAHGTLIFTNNNENALRLGRLLALLRPEWDSKISTLTKSSSSSRKTLSAFRKRKLSILIASDRASRGLDIQDLAHVINYDVPTSLTSYVHRVGRSARAGKRGLATTLVEHQQARWFWNQIGRSEKVVRGSGEKVKRVEVVLDVKGEGMKGYQAALATLGGEARGDIAGDIPMRSQ